jgi:hypothetical protein
MNAQVMSLSGIIDSEKAKTRNIYNIKMAVCMAQEFTSFLSRRIGQDGKVHAVGL